MFHILLNRSLNIKIVEKIIQTEKYVKTPWDESIKTLIH